MSASNIKDILSSRRRMVAAAAWMLVLVAALSAATYAWFSNSRYTNVTPVAHTVSDEGSDLQIGLSANGPWDTTATLAAADKTLYPISTADLSRFWRGTFQNAAGITTDYADCTAQLDDYALSGTLYLKGSDSALNVYLYQGQMSVTSDPQLLAALRLAWSSRPNRARKRISLPATIWATPRAPPVGVPPRKTAWSWRPVPRAGPTPPIPHAP